MCFISISCRHSRVADSDTKVVGGKQIGDGQTYFSPMDKSVYFMIMGTDNNGKPSSSICTGTFIAHNLLLTAAHCLTGNTYVLGHPSVRADGTLDVFVNPNTKALEAIKHPDYVGGRSHIEQWKYTDVGVIRFADQSQTPDRIAQLADPHSEKPRVGDRVTIIGYGRNDLIAEKGQNVKRMGTNKIDGINLSSGRITIQGIGVEGMSASDSENAIVGQGDSGGPVYNSAGKVIGIVSTNNADEIRALQTKNGRSDFVDVSFPKVRSFINEQLAKVSASPAPSPVQPNTKPIDKVVKVGNYTCEEQKGWGKCNEPWMTPVCDHVCKK